MTPVYLLLLWLTLVASAPRGASKYAWYDNCGDSPYTDAGTPFIIAGKAARAHEFPWTVSLRYGESFDESFCGGSIIHPDWILTAAHCVPNDFLSDLVVVVGEHDVTVKNSDTRKFHDVAKIIIHKDYSGWTLDNDIALLKLKTSVKLTANVSAVCAPDPDEDYTGTLAQVMGWGNTKKNGWRDPEKLMWVPLPIMDQKDCDRVMDVTDNMFCAGKASGNDRDSCQGDSGGPLTVKSDEKLFYLAGIVSWGYECAGDTPGVYTRVQNYVDWVSENMAN